MDKTWEIFEERKQWAATMIADSLFLILWYLLRNIPNWISTIVAVWIPQSNSWENQFADRAFPVVFTLSTFAWVLIVIIRDILIIAGKASAKLREEGVL